MEKEQNFNDSKNSTPPPPPPQKKAKKVGGGEKNEKGAKRERKSGTDGCVDSSGGWWKRGVGGEREREGREPRIRNTQHAAGLCRLQGAIVNHRQHRLVQLVQLGAGSLRTGPPRGPLQKQAG